MSRIHGFSYLEALISFALMSFILFGMDYLQIKSLKGSLAIQYFYIASIAANEINEKLSIKDVHNKCDIINEWRNQLRLILPQGEGMVSEEDTTTVTIAWGNRSLNECAATEIKKDGCLHVIY